MKVVDYVNGKLNNGEKTNYGESEYATKEVVDTIAANQAIRTLIKKNGPEYKFFFTPATTGNAYSFRIGAAGEYTIDWGDGTVENKTQSGTGYTTYTHTYSDSASNHTIGLGGKAAKYSSDTQTAAISFSYSSTHYIKSMDGCLGCIFGTLDSGSNKQPRFYGTFTANTALTGSIPETLFNGISGAPVSYMFYETFYVCSGLTGSIPENLFSGLSGAPAEFMFSGTFASCTSLTGSIPENLFAGIQGAPAGNMFGRTFQYCSGLTGSIPENLFAGISGKPAISMFGSTFYGCSGLTGSIPDKLFSGISGKLAASIFGSTFYGCSGLTGPIPDKLFGELSGAPEPYMFFRTFYGCSGLTGPIPDKLFGELSGAPAQYVFDSAFYDCSGLTSIPEHLFDGIDTSKPYQYGMFSDTFYNCTSLTGPSARIDGQYLYEIWPDVYHYTYYKDTGLSDYDCIPTDWGGGGKKTPGECPIPETE